MYEGLENMKHVKKNNTKEFWYGWQTFSLRERRLRIKKSGAGPQSLPVLPAYILGQWFPKYGPKPENLLEMGIPWAPPQTYLIRDSRGGIQQCGS